MRNGFRLFLMGALGVAVCGLTAAADGKRVTFDTVDGATLEGTFWAANPKPPATDKQATVLLLHNIDRTKGGSSHQDGWDDLAQSLSEDGYAVLSFDFRGFGNSHSVGKDFWDPIKGRHNLKYVQGGRKVPPPDSVDHKDFDNASAEYYPYLVNDVAAAKAFLDRQNDRGQANTSSLIVVGAGEGATLGAMWMYSEWHLKKANGIDPKTFMPTLDEPEGKDLAGAVWLDISPKLGGREIPGVVKSWMSDMGGGNKLPMVFIYGQNDDSAETFNKSLLRTIENKVQHDTGLDADKVKDKIKFTNVKAIEGAKVSGSQLLGAGDTPAFILKYVDRVMEDRGPREARKHDIQMDQFLWTFPGAPALDAKLKGEDEIHLVPIEPLLRVVP